MPLDYAAISMSHDYLLYAYAYASIPFISPHAFHYWLDFRYVTIVAEPMMLMFDTTESFSLRWPHAAITRYYFPSARR